MKTISLPIIIIMLATFSCLAQQPDTSFQRLKAGFELPSSVEMLPGSDGVFAIYPGDGVPEGSANGTRQERTIPVDNNERWARNIVIPTVSVFKPKKEKANGTAMVVAPGGAFTILSVQKEGVEVAEWLNELGITAFVLKYRVAPTPDDDAKFRSFFAALMESLGSPRTDGPPTGTAAIEKARLLSEEDGRQAIRYVRTNAEAFGINPNKIGIMGFSAGGGVTVNAALEYDSLSRPDFAGGIYAGWRAGVPVPDDAPSLFLAIAEGDKLVSPISSAQLYEMWHQAGRPVKLHIFNGGEHGFGTRKEGALTDSWTELFEKWLEANGFIQ